MKLSQLAKKPQLIRIEITDEDIVKEFGEPIEFWTWDRQPMDTFMKLANINPDNVNSVLEAVRTLVLDENAEPIITNDAMLPTNVMMRVLTRVVENLGKS
jgi:hypothetical protein